MKTAIHVTAAIFAAYALLGLLLFTLPSCAGTTQVQRLQTAQSLTAGAAVLCAQLPTLASQGLTPAEVAPLQGLCADLMGAIGHALEFARQRALEAPAPGQPPGPAAE